MNIYFSYRVEFQQFELTEADCTTNYEKLGLQSYKNGQKCTITVFKVFIYNKRFQEPKRQSKG